MEIIGVCPVQNNIRIRSDENKYIFHFIFWAKLCMHNFGIRFYFSSQGSLGMLGK